METYPKLDFEKLLNLKNNPLTKRELQCYFYLLKGRCAKETGQILGISRKTVEAYIASIKFKLNCIRRSELFDKGIEMGLITFSGLNNRNNI